MVHNVCTISTNPLREFSFNATCTALTSSLSENQKILGFRVISKFYEIKIIAFTDFVLLVSTTCYENLFQQNKSSTIYCFIMSEVMHVLVLCKT